MEISRKKFSAIVFLIVLGFSALSYQAYKWGTSSKPGPNMDFEDFPSSVSWKIGNDGAGNFSATNQYGATVYRSTNGSDVVQAALNATSLAGGGCVYIMPASLNGSVIVMNKTRLVIEKGVVGLSFSVNATATCAVADWNAGRLSYYKVGVLTFNENLDAGTVSQVSWVNSTNVEANGFWFGNQNRTDAVANPTSPYDYIISTDDTNYYMKNGTTGQNDFSSTNVSRVFANAIGNETRGGTTYVKAGNYSLTSSIVITGSWYSGIASDDIGSTWLIIGEGINDTLLSPSNNVDCITVKNHARVVLKDFMINAPTSGTTGCGIFGWDNGDTTDYGGVPFSGGSRIEDVRVVGGLWGFKIENPNLMTFSNIYSENFLSGAFWLYQTDNLYNWGDVTFEGTNLFCAYANNGIGILVSRAASAGSREINLLYGFGQMVFLNLNTYTNTTAMYMDYLNNAYIRGIHAENWHTVIYGNHMGYCTFTGDNTYSYLAAASDIFVSLTSSAQANKFTDWFSESGSSFQAFQDLNTNPDYPNIFESWWLRADTGCTISNTVSAGTVVRDIHKLNAGGSFTGFSGSPAGIVANPVLSGSTLVPWGGNASIANGTTYTCKLLPMTIYISGGTVSQVQVGGSTVYTATNCDVHLVPGETFSVTWSSAPTITVDGE
jgi:hypothetical protein